jgi:hypothetical protein
MTTGSTVLECTRVLLEAGVAFVTVACLGRDQTVIPLPDGPVSIRLNASDGRAFWGCSEYTRGSTGHTTMDWWLGIRAMNQLNRRDAIDATSDLPF